MKYVFLLFDEKGNRLTWEAKYTFDNDHEAEAYAKALVGLKVNDKLVSKVNIYRLIGST